MSDLQGHPTLVLAADKYALNIRIVLLTACPSSLERFASF